MIVMLLRPEFDVSFPLVASDAAPFIHIYVNKLSCHVMICLHDSISRAVVMIVICSEHAHMVHLTVRESPFRVS